MDQSGRILVKRCVYGKVKAIMRGKKALKPFTKASLESLAMYYAGRFAVSPAKLRSYLTRKIKERGLDEGFTPDLDQLTEKLSEYGIVSDAAVANMVISGQQRRGFGASRTRQQLRHKMVASDVAEASMEEQAVSPENLAILYAQKKRLGPFRLAGAADAKQQQKEMGAMVRGGHAPGLSSKIIRAPSLAYLAELFGLEDIDGD
jgi:regulatory protein